MLEILNAERIKAFGQLSEFYSVTYADESIKNVPIDLNNQDYIELKKWLDAQNKGKK